MTSVASAASRVLCTQEAAERDAQFTQRVPARVVEGRGKERAPSSLEPKWHRTRAHSKTTDLRPAHPSECKADEIMTSIPRLFLHIIKSAV